MGITQQGSRCKGELNAWDATQKPVGPRQNLSANEKECSRIRLRLKENGFPLLIRARATSSFSRKSVAHPGGFCRSDRYF